MAVQFNMPDRVLTGVDSQIFAIMPKSKIKSQNDGIKVLAQEVQPLSPFPAVPYVVQVMETTGKSLRWDGLSSHIKLNQGHFYLDSVNNVEQTSVTFALRIEASLLVPELLIRRQLNTIMPDTLKAQAESLSTSLTLVQLATDSVQ